MDTIRTFFYQNQGTFFDFQKRAGEASPLPHPPPSCVPALRVTLLILPIIWLTTLSSVKASFHIKILILAVVEEIRLILLAKALVIATSLIIPECRVDPLCQEFSGMREKRSSKACSTQFLTGLFWIMYHKNRSHDNPQYGFCSKL